MHSRIRVHLILEGQRGKHFVLLGTFDRVSPVLNANEALKLFEALLLRVARGPEGLWREPGDQELESQG
jgi:hypothetical protein